MRIQWVTDKASQWSDLIKATPRAIIPSTQSPIILKITYFLKKQQKKQSKWWLSMSHSPLSRQHHVSWETLICKHKQIQWVMGWKNHSFWISFQNRLSLTSLRHWGWLQACLLENWLLMKFDAGERPSFLPTIYWPGLLNYSHSEHNMWIKLLHTSREKRVYQKSCDHCVEWMVLSCLVLTISSNFGIQFLDANNGWAWWKRWSE